jgi:hypothetical protein
MDPRSVYKWLAAVSAAPPARGNRVVLVAVLSIVAMSAALSEHYRKDNGGKQRAIARVKLELNKHAL